MTCMNTISLKDYQSFEGKTTHAGRQRFTLMSFTTQKVAILFLDLRICEDSTLLSILFAY